LSPLLSAVALQCHGVFFFLSEDLDQVSRRKLSPTHRLSYAMNTHRIKNANSTPNTLRMSPRLLATEL